MDTNISSSDTRGLENQTMQRLQEASDNLTRANERALTFVREHPVPCIVGALSVGYLIGKIAARS